MFLGTGNSFLALRIHFEHYFGQGAATGGGQGGQTASPQKWAKMTIWVSIPMFLGTRNSFLGSRIHFEDYFGQGAATRGRG